MKVWIVMKGDYDGCYVKAVCASEALANQRMAEIAAGDPPPVGTAIGYDYWVDEHDVDS